MCELHQMTAWLAYECEITDAASNIFGALHKVAGSPRSFNDTRDLLACLTLEAEMIEGLANLAQRDYDDKIRVETRPRCRP